MAPSAAVVVPRSQAPSTIAMHLEHVLADVDHDDERDSGDNDAGQNK
jgi:hypothetical protein